MEHRPDTFTGTTQEIGILMGIEYQTTLGVLKYLKSKGIVQDAGIRPNSTGKGKGSNLYTIPKGPITLEFVP